MKLALISGGSRGLGAELCYAYRNRGFEIREFSRTAPHPWSIHCDLADTVQAETVLSKSLAPYANAPLEELVAVSNAATLAPIGFAGTASNVESMTNIAANFSGAVLFMSQILRFFQSLPCRKTLINMSSGAALKVYPGWSLYCAAKAGLEHYVQVLSAEQSKATSPFRVANFDPGVMDTAMQALIRGCRVEDFPDVARFRSRFAAGELRSPSEVAEAVCRALAAPAALGLRQSVGDWLA